MKRRRNLRSERMPFGRERKRALNAGAYKTAEITEIENGAEVNVRSFVPWLGQVPGHGHPAIEQDLQADLPMAEIRKGNDDVARDPKQFLKHVLGTSGRLERAAENGVIESLIGIV